MAWHTCAKQNKTFEILPWLQHLMVRALSAAQHLQNLSLAKEQAYRDAVSLYLESHHDYETSSDPKRKRPISL